MALWSHERTRPWLLPTEHNLESRHSAAVDDVSRYLMAHWMEDNPKMKWACL